MITFEQATELQPGDALQFDGGDLYRVVRVDANLKRRYLYIELARERDGWPSFATEHMLHKAHKVTLVSLGNSKDDTQEVEPIVDTTEDNQGFVTSPVTFDQPILTNAPTGYNLAEADEPLATEEPEDDGIVSETIAAAYIPSNDENGKWEFTGAVVPTEDKDETEPAPKRRGRKKKDS